MLKWLTVTQSDLVTGFRHCRTEFSSWPGSWEKRSCSLSLISTPPHDYQPVLKGAEKGLIALQGYVIMQYLLLLYRKFRCSYFKVWDSNPILSLPFGDFFTATQKSLVMQSFLVRHLRRILWLKYIWKHLCHFLFTISFPSGWTNNDHPN